MVEEKRLWQDKQRHFIHTAHGTASCLAGSRLTCKSYGTADPSHLVFEDSKVTSVYKRVMPEGEDRVATPPNWAVPRKRQGLLAPSKNVCPFSPLRRCIASVFILIVCKGIVLSGFLSVPLSLGLFY